MTAAAFAKVQFTKLCSHVDCVSSLSLHALVLCPCCSKSSTFQKRAMRHQVVFYLLTIQVADSGGSQSNKHEQNLLVK